MLSTIKQTSKIFPPSPFRILLCCARSRLLQREKPPGLLYSEIGEWLTEWSASSFLDDYVFLSSELKRQWPSSSMLDHDDYSNDDDIPLLWGWVSIRLWSWSSSSPLRLHIPISILILNCIISLNINFTQMLTLIIMPVNTILIDKFDYYQAHSEALLFKRIIKQSIKEPNSSINQSVDWSSLSWLIDWQAQYVCLCCTKNLNSVFHCNAM